MYFNLNKKHCQKRLFRRVVFKLTLKSYSGIISVMRFFSMLRSILCVLLLTCFLFTGCGKKEKVNDDLSAILQRDKLIVGVKDDTVPFGFRDENNDIIGYDIDLARVIAYSLLGNDAKIELIPVTPSNRIMKLNAGEVDMLISTMSITNQRLEVVDFSTPYYIAGQAIMVNKSNDATTIRDFSGKKMIIVFGSTSEKNLRMNVPDVKVIGYKTYPEAYKALKENKAEAMIADDTILLGFLRKDSSLKLLPKRYSREPYAVAFRKSDKSLSLEKEVNYIIENLQKTGKLKKMQQKWGI